MSPNPKILSKLLLISFLLTPIANAWVEAPSDGSNILAPLNASSVEQTKEGRLGVRGGLALSITTAQRDALQTPAEGLLIYNTDSKQLEIYSVGVWKAIGTGSGDTTPLGTIAYFDLDACPQGWTEVTDARGRYLVGTPGGGVRGVSSVTGQSLTNQENRAVGQHAHSAAQNAHSHSTYHEVSSNVADVGSANSIRWIAAQFGWGSWLSTAVSNVGSTHTASGSTSGSAQPVISVDNAGSVIGTNAPYIQFLVCKKTSASSSGSSSGGSSGTDAFWKKTGNDVYYNDGNVGVGTSTPTQKMEVTGNVKVNGSLCLGNDCKSTWPQAEQSWWVFNTISGYVSSYDLYQKDPMGSPVIVNAFCGCHTSWWNGMISRLVRGTYYDDCALACCYAAFACSYE